MKRVLLINPAMPRKKGNLWKAVLGILPPQALAIIAALLEKKNHSVRIFDMGALHIPMKNVKEYLNEQYGNFKPDFVGITITTMLTDVSCEIAKICKDVWPNCKVVAGGVHATAKPGELIEHKEIDYVLRGEGEQTFLELVEGRPLRNILGITYCDKKGNTIHNKERPLLKKLDELPLPAYHLLPMEKYVPSVGSYKRLPAISMVVSRGCPGKCTFCYQPYGLIVRMRSATKIFEEVKLLVEKYNMMDICFYDDNFCTYQENVKEFCKLMIDYTKKTKRRIGWSCFSRVDWIEEETVRLMKKAGCHRIMFGVESANEKVLNNIKKNIDLQQVLRAHAIIKNQGIDTHAAFMFGNPGETEESMKETIDFALKLDPTIAQFNILAPNPGTEVYEWAKKHGYLKKKQWKDYDLYTPIMRLPTISPELLQKYYKLAFRKFYLRPRYISKRLLRLFYNPYEIKNTLAGFKAAMSVIISK